ncbi:MAG: hypothetical protein HZC47_04185 [Methanobacterium sp.]|uniref:hypothetical protein n=1 Tax=Methanobacterium sp. TaxID=2164 RepID=UPI003D64AAF9|nr:hypothetical protein [Methanobacterium sp.]
MESNELDEEDVKKDFKVHQLDRHAKSSKQVIGINYYEKAGEIYTKDIKRLYSVTLGQVLKPADERPSSGSTIILPDQEITSLLQVLIANQLIYFEHSKVSIDFYVSESKAIVDREQEIEKDRAINLRLYPTPISSELMYDSVIYNQETSVELFFRINIIDQQLNQIDLNEYSEGVLNTFNPLVLFLVFYPSLKNKLEMLKPEKREHFDSVLKFVASRSRDAQEKFAKDKDTLIEYVTMGFLHEIVHALITHLPDKDISGVSEEENARRAQFSFSKYREKLIHDEDLVKSTVYYKNAIKALSKARLKNPDYDVDISLTVEMFCDRFSMFLYENYLKILACQTAFQETYPDNLVHTKVIFALKKAMINDSLENNAYPEIYPELNQFRLSSEQFETITTEFKKAEHAHVYINKFGDPELKEWEYEFFEKFLGLLQKLDEEKKTCQYSEDHWKSSHAIDSGEITKGEVILEGRFSDY